MSDKSYQRFSIEGAFLTPPKKPTGPPVLIVDCVPGEHRYGGGWVGGYFNQARVTLGGAILGQGASGVIVNFRRDGEAKVQVESWSGATDFTAAFMSYSSLVEMLYGHMTPPHADKAIAVKKLRIAVDEFQAVKIVAEFNLPESPSMAEACGLVMRKGK